ncbi:hypothetical protein B0I35DRAFT_413331 [Stachybotrys elegans]|uniref:Uncharacterized protein n=1 Tax=Stachybotrys elegans TaxID=80388 RepID=A0A8K0WLX0_9HYPO|nr:hypothetical protein B0I35DRAFT_413331 [Stachybotrys elegans]
MRSLNLIQWAAYGALLQGATAAVVQNTKSEDKRQAKKCSSDNCGRAVTGLARGPAVYSSHLADCAAFMQCTVTPVDVTIISTVTQTLDPVTETSITQLTQMVTLTETVTRGAAKRTVEPEVTSSPVTNCPTVVPTYASACSGTVRYASACDCAGYTRDFTTIEAATVVVKATVTETPAKVVVPATETVTATTINTVVAEPPLKYVEGPFRIGIEGGAMNGKGIGSISLGHEGWDRISLYVRDRDEFLDSTWIMNTEGVMNESGRYDVKLRPGEYGGEIGTLYSYENEDWKNDQTWSKLTWSVYRIEGSTRQYIKPDGPKNIVQACNGGSYWYGNWFVWVGSRLESGCVELRLRVDPGPQR